MFDFYNNSYTFITGLFTVIFGMAFPLILQCIREFGIRKGLKKLVISSKIRIFIGENQ